MTASACTRMMSVFGLWRLLCLGVLLLFAQRAAHADLWAFTDARGVTHFAAEQIDTRYQLFFRGSEFDSTRDAVPADRPTPGAGPTATGARLLAFFDISPDYKRVKHHLRAAASRQGVDYELLQALIATESGFDADAVSPRGAIGLMQLLPTTAARFGVAKDGKRSVEQKLVDPGTNVAAGTAYLRHLLDLFAGRMDLALAAYNAGEGAVQRAGNRIPAYRETQNYVKSVLGLYTQLKPPAPVQAQRARPGAGRLRMELPATPAVPGPVGMAPPLSAPVRVAQRTPLDLQATE